MDSGLHVALDGMGRTDVTWAVVSSHVHQEQLAIRHLERQDFHVYCPMISRQVRHARSIRDVVRPLFPGYVFVQVNLEGERWRVIQSTYGVRSLVRVGLSPAVLENRVIVALRSRETDGVISSREKLYKIGDDVCMAGGAFDGIVAKIIAIDAKDRLTVLMSLLNRMVRTRVEPHAVVKA